VSENEAINEKINTIISGRK